MDLGPWRETHERYVHESRSVYQAAVFGTNIDWTVKEPKKRTPERGYIYTLDASCQERRHTYLIAYTDIRTPYPTLQNCSLERAARPQAATTTTTYSPAVHELPHRTPSNTQDSSSSSPGSAGCRTAEIPGPPPSGQQSHWWRMTR